MVGKRVKKIWLDMKINRVALIVTLSFPAVIFPCILVRSRFSRLEIFTAVFFSTFLFPTSNISSMTFKFYYSCFAKIFRILFYAGLI